MDNFQAKTGEASGLSLLSTGPRTMGRKGMPLGIREDGSPMVIDPWLDVEEERIPAPIYMTTGKIRCGKTALQKITMNRFGLFSAGDRAIRVVTDGFKRNDGVPEYGPIAERFGAESIDLAEARLNVLDPAMGMTIPDQLAMLRDIVVYLRGDAKMQTVLSDNENTALRCAVHEVDRLAKSKGETPSLELLLTVLNQYRDLHPLLPNGEEMDIPREEFEAACRNLMHVFVRLTGGDFGNMFGGTASLADKLSRRMVSLDYSQIDQKSMILVQSLLWGWRRTFLQRGMDRFIADAMFGDENYEQWRYEVYARQMNAFVRQVRMTGGLVSLCTHQLGDYIELSKYAEEMLEHISAFFFGRTTKNEVERLRAMFGADEITDRFARELVELEQGTFIYYVPGRCPEKFRVVPTPHELVLIDSDVANRRMLGRT